jgi:hypothetical protein
MHHLLLRLCSHSVQSASNEKLVLETWVIWMHLSCKTLFQWGKWGLKEYIWGGSFLGGSIGSSSRYKRFLFCLGCSSRPSTKYVFPKRALFQFNCTHHPASWAWIHAGSPGLRRCWASSNSTCRIWLTVIINIFNRLPVLFIEQTPKLQMYTVHCTGWLYYIA